MSQPRSGANPDKPDWSASLDLIRHTVEAMRASADRAQKMEARTQALLQRAAKELENAHERIETLEARLRACEAREKQAEARAKDAEEWLRRIHDAIAEELPFSVSLLAGLRLSGISCLGGHDGWKGAQPCRDAKSLIFRMPSWTSCWLGRIPRRRLIRTAFSTA